MPTNLPKCEKYVVQRVTGKFTYNYKELLTFHPRVEPVRIGQYHEREFGLPGELVDKGA